MSMVSQNDMDDLVLAAFRWTLNKSNWRVYGFVNLVDRNKTNISLATRSLIAYEINEAIRSHNYKVLSLGNAVDITQWILLRDILNSVEEGSVAQGGQSPDDSIISRRKKEMVERLAAFSKTVEAVELLAKDAKNMENNSKGLKRVLDEAEESFKHFSAY